MKLENFNNQRTRGSPKKDKNEVVPEKSLKFERLKTEPAIHKILKNDETSRSRTIDKENVSKHINKY